MKRWISLLLVAIMVLSLCLITGCGKEQSAPAESVAAPQKLIYIHGSSDTSILQYTAEKFKELLEAKSNGRYTVEIHGNFELGNMSESVEMIKAGEVALSGVCLGSQYTPKLGFLDLPNAVPSIDAAYKLYCESDFRGTAEEIMHDEGIEMLAFGPVYFREMTSNKPVHTADDIKGINIRTMENSLHMAYWTALGANPSPLAWAETYIGLQQGLVDAQENPLDSIVGGKLYEVQKYVVYTHHILYTSPILMNGKFFEGLTPEDQEMFKTCGKEAEQAAYAYAREYEAELAKQLTDNGMEFITLPDAELNTMKERASSVYDTVREQIGDETMDAFLKGVEDVTK